MNTILRSLKSLAAMGLCAFALNAPAQTTLSLPPAGLGASTNGDGTNSTFLQELGQVASDGWNQIKNMSLSNGIVVEPVAIKHGGDWGGGLAARTANTNGLNVGFGLFMLSDTTVKNVGGKKVKSTSLDFYDANLSIEANGSVTVPYLNWKFDSWIETGPAANLRDPKTVYEQSFAGIRKTWHINYNWDFTAQAGVGHCSKWSGDMLREFGLALTCKLKGTHFAGLW